MTVDTGCDGHHIQGRACCYVVGVGHIDAAGPVQSTGSIVPVASALSGFVRSSRSGRLWMFGAKVLRRLRTRFVSAHEHHVDATDAGLGFGDVSSHVERSAAGSAPALGFRMAGGHGSTVRLVWRGSQRDSRQWDVVRSGDSG